MRRFLLGLLFILLSIGAWADLTFPSTFQVIETAPSHFELTITVPLIKGRYMKVHPMLPNGFQSKGEPNATTGAASLTRTWSVDADPALLPGSVFGLDGLLGSAQEVRFQLGTQDGRRHETVLRPTRSVFVVPHPISRGRLILDALQNGLRISVRNGGQWFLLAGTLLASWPMRNRIWMTMFLLAGFLIYWSLSSTVLRAGLSTAEYNLSNLFLIIGCGVGSIGSVVSLQLIRLLLTGRLRIGASTLAQVLAAAWIIYHGAGLVVSYGGGWLDGLQRMALYLGHHWFSPFAGDWAMAKLRIPLLSLVMIALLARAFFTLKKPRVKNAVAGAFLLLSFVCLPYGVARAPVPFASPKTPSAEQARRIMEPMLSEIYHALNLEDENQTYDRLAEQVSGDLVTDLYLDSRRRLVAGTRDGAIVTVRQVEMNDVGAPQTTAIDGSPIYPCQWTVTAKVTHWQHTHLRKNVYQGELCLAVENDRWKLSQLNLRSEERTVVSGSFSSR